MTFDSSQADAQSTYQGQAYFFCSAECRKLFDENPEEYLQNQADTTTDEPIPL
jgi:YHS domain-containing protein